MKMKTKAQIEAQLKLLRERLEADDFDDAEENDTPDWVDTSNRITALEWVLGIQERTDI